MVDIWNPDTFGLELLSLLRAESQLVSDFYSEKDRLMKEHLNSSTYQSLKPNRFDPAFSSFKENNLTPVLTDTRIRVWHYTRLLDHEVEMMQQRLVPSSLDFLENRLQHLVEKGMFTKEEADRVYQESPFHSQKELRSGRLWTVTLPLHCRDEGVLPLLENWGGESAYSELSDELLAAKLKRFGAPRVIEIETSLSDRQNAFMASDTVLEAWAKSLGVSVALTGCDLAITNCLCTAKLVRVLTEGERAFEELAKTYPEGISEKIN
ncbi:hypothetical protein [Hahella sp. NBU794]|uniref:hypothetical protein n=1 Tax=Hahella sp. NBU794 TaxID=3422590 RepID=UPI003D6EF1A1